MHVLFLTSNASGMLGYIELKFMSVPISLKQFLCKTLVWSKLEQAPSIWDYDLDILTSVVEAIRNRSAKFTLTITALSGSHLQNLVLT